MTILQVVEGTCKRLSVAGIDSALLESQMIVGHALGQDRNWVMTHPEVLWRNQRLEEFVRRRVRREPLAYILGWREFYSRKFSVGPEVLIPRHETETVIELGLSLITEIKSPKILDIGTGSGCLAITFALERTDALLFASDISNTALEIAEQNATDLSAHIQTRHSDLFDYWQGEKFDLIVSNPPYVGVSDDLPPEVKLYEPATALFPEQNNGEEYDVYINYRRLAKVAHTHVYDKGTIIVEVGDHQSNDVAKIFENENWTCIEKRKDLEGMERAIAFVRRP